MTREEAIDMLKDMKFEDDEDCIENKALDIAIEALSAEPCDCISREQALSDYADWFGYGYDNNTFYKHLTIMPSVQPKPKTGHWIRVTDKTGHLVWECDKCNWQQRFNTNFCPDCGAKMVEPQNLNYADADTMMPAT